MFSTTITALVLLGLRTATSQVTTSLFLPGFDQQTLVASVQGSSGSTTTMVLNCAPGTDDTDCGLSGFTDGLTYTVGPSSMAFTMSVAEEVDAVSCIMTGTTFADCTATAVGAAFSSGASFDPANTGLATTVIATTLTQGDITYLPVIITAGAGVVASNTAAANTAAETTAAAQNSGGSSGVVTKTSGTATTPKGTATGASSVPTNAAGRMGMGVGMGAVGAVAAVVAML